MSKYPLIRTIYLYLFSFIGLVLIVIGTVKFVNMALKTYVFTQADQEQYKYMDQPQMPPMKIAQPRIDGGAETTLTREEKQAYDQWMADYTAWKARTDKIDVMASRRQSEAADNLAFIIVGIPLYWFHWRLIKREAKQ
jgi:hypothetical protein